LTSGCGSCIPTRSRPRTAQNWTHAFRITRQDPFTSKPKWNAALGTGKGSAEGAKNDQVELRRESMRADPALIDDKREFAVLGVSNAVPDLTAYAEHGQTDRKRVTIAWLTRDDLASCDDHPRAEEFRRYLEWKRDVFKASAS
jgi:hypothetical protein